MSPKTRSIALWLALAGVGAWSAWLAVNDDAGSTGAADPIELAKPVRPAQVAQPARSASGKAKADTQSRLALARANLFPEQTWFVAPPPPPPPPPAPPPPPPQAPPLPFTYMGRWQEAGQTTYYLARGATAVMVKPGQVVDGVWRLEPVTGNVLNFTYLPLNQTRSLRAGD